MPRHNATEAYAADPPRRSKRIAQPPPAVTHNKKRKLVAGKVGATAPAAADAPSGEGDATTEPISIPTLEIGSNLPSLTVKNEKAEDVDVAQLATEKGVVLFLVPKADTPGCTMQACGFRDIYEDFAAVDFDVYCLSADSPTAQTKWQTKKELPYQLLSDPKRVLISALGAGEGGKTKRSHFIFEKGGKLVDKKIPVKPVDSPKLALEFIKASQEAK